MLKILPQNISNLIAAGEVVQRPASVVKELVENAIDAGADSISVIIEDSGRTLIQVIDNGCGMTSEEAKLCFARHATSKIDAAEDLERINTYGFRGEALPSIAAIAEVTVKTRKKGEETGSETVFADSAFVSQEETMCPEGTNIAVRNIFYNTPARRKFLKTDAAEFRQIITEFSRVALVRPNIAIKLIHNGKTVYELKKSATLKKRILEIDGSARNKELIDLGVSSSIVKISGYVGDPKDARKGTGYQYFFVNGRFFRSPYFNKAVLKAYDKLLPDGYAPSYYIYMETEPGSVDINIHPTKTEVKFENEPSIFEILYAATRESLGSNAFTPSIDFDMRGVPQMPPSPSSSTHIHPPKIDYNPLFDPFTRTGHSTSGGNFPGTPSEDSPLAEFSGSNDFDPDTFLSSSELEMGRANNVEWNSSGASASTVTPTAAGNEYVDGYPSILEDKSVHSDLLVLHNKFILTPVKSGILVISISRARERIFYERFLHSLDEEKPVVQGTLFPVMVDLAPADYAVLMEDPDRLKALGFDIRSFGPSTVVVNGIPEGLSAESEAVQDAVTELISIFTREDAVELRRADIRHRMALTLSGAAARTGAHTLTASEGQMLVERLFACTEPSRTPDGRKTMEILTLEAIGKLL